MKRRTIAFIITVLLILSTSIFSMAAIRVKTIDIRLGGKTRIETALKCSNEVFKKTGRFKTVIVAYAQNFPDALSGGYLSKLTGAPIILTNDQNTQSTINYIKSKSVPKAKVYILGGTGVVGGSIKTKLKQAGFNVVRLGGDTRYETNLKILSETKAKGTELLVASGTGYADSLSGSSVGRPILLVGTSLTNEQKAFLKNGKFTRIYILGGTGAVSKTVETSLKSYAPVERIGGLNRFETSKLIADKFFPKADTVVLAYGQDFPDGLTGGALGALLNAPVLLVSNSNWKDAHNYVVAKKVKNSFTMGGTSVISDKTVSAIMEQYEETSAPVNPTNPTTPTHTHTFDKGWSKDADYHWHSATCKVNDACKTAVSDKAKHTWKDVTEYEEKKVEITKTEVHTICKACREDIDIKFAELQAQGASKQACIEYHENHVKTHILNGEVGGWTSATVEIGTGEYETIQVPKIHKECSICGYRQG